jgi:hypothetical protein
MDERPLSMLGWNFLTFGPELNDAIFLFLGVMAAQRVKGLRRSTENVERQMNLIQTT